MIRSLQSRANALQHGWANVASILLLLMTIALSGCEKRNATPEGDAAQSDNMNVVSPDWGNAATLTAMGHPPIATGDMRVWDDWVGEPKLPASVTDLGIRYQPNAELVAQLPVDMVIDNYFYEHARRLYDDVPAKSVIFQSKDATASWQDYVNPTQQLGRIIDRPQDATNYISLSQAQIKAAGQRLHARFPHVSKFAVVQFVDANNMRMYVKNSLFNVVFTLMGYELVVLNEGNSWGFTSIQLGDLTRLNNDVCLLIIEPLNPLTEAALKTSLVWQRLGYSGNQSGAKQQTSRCMAKLPPIWIYGGMASLTELANNLAAAELSQGGEQ